MRLFLMALPFWLWGLTYGEVLSGQGGEQAPAVPVVQAEPQYVVIFSLPVQENVDGSPFVDLRIVIRAENEYVAVIRATLFIKDNMNMPSHLQSRLKFQAVEVRKPSLDLPKK